MTHNTRHLYWTTLLTAIWLAASVFAYSGVFETTYKESDKQQSTSIEHTTPIHWDILYVSNDMVGNFIECYWWIANVVTLTSNSIGSIVINPPDRHQYDRLNQSISLISYQYYLSALPA